MSTAVRDRSARARVREYLAQQGPIEDASGRATALLKDAVNYKGSAVAFIQLVTAMDKASEIKREIRGKRTYKISAVGVGSGGNRPYAASRSTSVVTGAGGASYEIDYEELARAVLREMVRVYADVGADLGRDLDAESQESLDAVRSERDRLLAERDDYMRRLQVARRQLSALISGSLPESDAPDVGVRRVEQAS
jgi:hypothetical protein